jgi:hypothetical protein
MLIARGMELVAAGLAVGLAAAAGVMRRLALSNVRRGPVRSEVARASAA